MPESPRLIPLGEILRRRRLWSPGQIIAARYRLETLLNGGFENVAWIAQDIQDAISRARVVVKCSNRHEHRDLFVLREALALERLGRLLDVHIDHNLACVVTDYVAGISLWDAVRRGPIETKEVRRIGIGVCRELEKAHAAGVVHGDVRPRNILVADVVSLIDFEHARFAGEDGASPRLDVRQLAITLCQGLEGRVYRDSHPYELPPNLAADDPHLRAAITRALLDGFADAAAFAAALRAGG